MDGLLYGRNGRTTEMRMDVDALLRACSVLVHAVAVEVAVYMEKMIDVLHGLLPGRSSPWRLLNHSATEWELPIKKTGEGVVFAS